MGGRRDDACRAVGIVGHRDRQTDRERERERERELTEFTARSLIQFSRIFCVRSILIAKL